MKRSTAILFLYFGIIMLAALISSCSSYTCATYSGSSHKGKVYTMGSKTDYYHHSQHKKQ